DLQRAFEELGVESGRELIETSGGLIQALQALEAVAGDNERRFAAFFGRIRGQLGALNILSDNASSAKEILGELGDNAGRAADEVQTLEDLDVRESERAFAQLNDTLVNLGESTQQFRTFWIRVLNEVISLTGVW